MHFFLLGWGGNEGVYWSLLDVDPGLFGRKATGMLASEEEELEEGELEEELLLELEEELLEEEL